MGKRPSFQFYPADWLQDLSLRSCSIEARGLWIDMIALMHQGYPYGHLKVNHKVVSKVNLARIVGLTEERLVTLLDELREHGVFSETTDGTIYCRRMVRDEKLREVRAAGGFKGGNPQLMKNGKVNLKPNLIDNLDGSVEGYPPPEEEEEDEDYSLKGGAGGGRKKRKVTIPPSIEEIGQYCTERGNGIDPTVFFDYYQARGWLLGKNRMKDWRAAVRTWERNNFEGPKKSGGGMQDLKDFLAENDRYA